MARRCLRASHLLVVGALAAALVLSCAGRRERSNVLLITVDTTRADHLAPYGYRDIRTPFIGALASRGVLFERAFTPVPITLPSHASMLTGTYPATHGVRDNGIYKLGDDARTLAEVLKEAGYLTAAVVGSFVLDGRFGLPQGFDLYDDTLELDLDKSRYRFQERRAAQVTDNAIEWLRGRRRGPFFLWVHYFDPHAEYDPPSPYREIYRDNPYDGEIAYVDEQIGRLLKELVEEKELEQTLVVLVGDHGEGLWEHGEATHGIFVYDSTIRVPMIMAYPARLPRGLRVESPARTVDLMPTILGLMEVGLPPGIEGVDLVPAMRDAARAALADSSGGVGAAPTPQQEDEWFVLVEQRATAERFGWSPLTGIRTNRFKYIEAPVPELYDLESDPHEYLNIVTERPDVADALRERLQREAPPEKEGSRRRVTLDAETEERLRALGYVWGPSRPDPDSGDGGDPKLLLDAFYRITSARALTEQGLYDQAVEQYDAALAIDPGNYMALIDLCLLSVEAPDWRAIARRATELLEEADSPAIQFLLSINLGNVHLERGDIDAAEPYYRRAQALDPENPIPPANLGLILMMQGRFDESQVLYEQASAADPDFPDAMHYMGALSEARGDTREAERIYRQLLAKHPQFVPAMNSLAWLWAREGRNLEEARRLAERAVQERPRDPDYIDTLGWIRYQMEDFLGSAELLERATSLSAGNPEIEFHLALAYSQTGRIEDAIRLLEGALGRETPAGEPWVEEARKELSTLRAEHGSTGRTPQ